VSGPRAYAGGRAGPPWRRPLIAGVFAVLLLGLLLSKIASGGDPVPGEGTADASGAAPPQHIRIPSIGVSADVVPLGLNPDGTLAAPRSYHQTGWYAAGPEPGEQGPSVVAGHVDSRQGRGVFYRLHELRRGDTISFDRSDGSSVAFKVDRLERRHKDDFPTGSVYGRTPGSTLRLVTCSGDFNTRTGHYSDNTIVYASR
jgi:LPXTG-site transpeptidase (sortase) family protein